MQQYGMMNKQNIAEQKLLVELWQILEGEKRNGVSLLCLITAVCAILKAQATQDLKATITDNGQGISIGCFVNDNTWLLNPFEQEYMHKKFYPFYLSTISQQKEVLCDVSYTHKPELSNQTERLAAKASEKRKEILSKLHPKGKKETIADMLAAAKHEQDIQFSKYISKIKAEKEQECTFRPKVNPRAVSKSKLQYIYILYCL